jgi:hypothetical protein
MDMMKEDFLSYIWKFQLIKNKLITTDGEALEVLRTGVQNQDAGPDFTQAMVRIGDTLWAGSIEIHVRGSDWYRHGHQDDPAYKGVILHIVHDPDVAVFRNEREVLPTLVLKDSYELDLYAKYQDFLKSQMWIPCAGQLGEVPLNLLKTFLTAFAIERMEERSALISNLLQANLGDLEETTHQFFARGFGVVINMDPFEQIARILPFSLCRRYKDQELMLQALALGQAGFLKPGFGDSYPKVLWETYQYLRNKHQLKPMSLDSWKFLRMRPTGFPTVRLAQWAAFLKGRHSLVSEFLQESDSKKILGFLQNKLDIYWETHFIPDRPARRGASACSEGFIRVWACNSLAPMLIFYGRHKERQDRVELALSILESFPPELNKILAGWAENGIEATNALEGQGLIYLKKYYCDKKRCLSCSIGNYLLRKPASAL